MKFIVSECLDVQLSELGNKIFLNIFIINLLIIYYIFTYHRAQWNLPRWWKKYWISFFENFEIGKSHN